MDIYNQRQCKDEREKNFIRFCSTKKLIGLGTRKNKEKHAKVSSHLYSSANVSFATLLKGQCHEKSCSAEALGRWFRP